MNAMLDARIVKRLPARGACSDFELSVQLQCSPGITILFGASGAGKSLTLDAIAGFVRPDDGRILINDRLLFDAASLVDLPPRERRCGCVFQGDALFPHMSLRENLWFAAARVPRRERRARVQATLERFRIAELGERYPRQLSGGQRQRGAISLALLSEPELLLLDEPARGLEAPLREEFYALLREVRESYALPILLVTHDIHEALQLGDAMHVLVDGQLAQSGTPREILAAPASAAVAQLLGCYNLLHAEILGLDPSAKRSRLRISCPDGRSFEIVGPYLSGLLLGANVTLAIREDEIEVGLGPAAGIRLALRRLAPLSQGSRAELEGGIFATLPDDEPFAQAKFCQVRFPPQSLRLVKS
jgi:molybdate transport system ATP-binding protein